MLLLSENDVHLEGDVTQYILANDNGSSIEYSTYIFKNTKWFYQSLIKARG